MAVSCRGRADVMLESARSKNGDVRVAGAFGRGVEMLCVSGDCGCAGVLEVEVVVSA